MVMILIASDYVCYVFDNAFIYTMSGDVRFCSKLLEKHGILFIYALDAVILWIDDSSCSEESDFKINGLNNKWK